MFTGLIQELGEVVKVSPNSEGCELIIRAPKLISEIKIDDSVATNGTCLTATKIDGDTFTTQAVHVTLEKTSTGKLKAGSKVNLELALRASDRLGGHFVQGHVNAKGKLVKVVNRGGNYELSFELPQTLMKYMISEGSIAIEGISLTLARVENNIVTVSIIPHTWEVTNLSTKKVGDEVNIEADMLAKYLENFMKYKQSKPLTIETLKEQGY